MSALTLTKTKFTQGLWQGVLTGSGADKPAVDVTFESTPVEGVTLAHNPEADHWALSIPIPTEAVADGVHTLLVRDAQADETLDQITLIAGEVLGDDIRAEMELLRAELDMLKRAFRRHCLES